MRRWIILLSAALLLVIVVVLLGVRRGSEPNVIITIRELHNGRRITFNQTPDGKYRRQILSSYTLRPISNLNWSPDDTSMIIVNFDGIVYRYGFYSGHLQRIDCPLCPFPGTDVQWSEDGSGFFIIASTELLIFHNDTWYTYSNGDVAIESAYWSEDRIVLTDYSSRITSVNVDGEDRITMNREYDTLTDVYDGAIYTFNAMVLNRIYLVDQLTRPLVRFEPMVHNYTTPAISPDERFVIYVGQDHVPYLVDLKSSDRSPLVNTALCAGRCEFRWSPDSKHLLIFHEERFTGATYWFHADLTSRTIKKLTDSGSALDAAWGSFVGLNWHPLWHLSGVVIALIAKRGIRIMV